MSDPRRRLTRAIEAMRVMLQEEPRTRSALLVVRDQLVAALHEVDVLLAEREL